MAQDKRFWSSLAMLDRILARSKNTRTKEGIPHMSLRPIHSVLKDIQKSFCVVPTPVPPSATQLIQKGVFDNWSMMFQKISKTISIENSSINV